MDPHQRVETLNDLDALEPLAAALDQRVPESLRSGPARDALAGVWIGHALHPMLTDLPIGTWTSATLLDVLGPSRWRGASATLTGIGLLASVPTVASGWVEWGNIPSTQRRVAATHAGLNAVAAGCYLFSLVAKVAGRTRVGTGAAVVGALALGAGGYLGGHLSLGRGVGVGDRSGSTMIDLTTDASPGSRGALDPPTTPPTQEPT
jgi:uncharacterized membrane protein